ncbi:MAG: hypothetical protein ACE5JA_08785, partial [bacterium]
MRAGVRWSFTFTVLKFTLAFGPVVVALIVKLYREFFRLDTQMKKLYHTVVRVYERFASKTMVVVFLLLILLFGYLFPRSAASFTARDGPTHLDMELACQKDAWGDNVRQWGEYTGSIESAVQNYRVHLLTLDTVFPVVYVILLLSAIAVLTKEPEKEPPDWVLILFLLPVLGGVFDLAENFMHIHILLESVGDLGSMPGDLIRLSFVFTVLKWVLIVVPVAGAILVKLYREFFRMDRQAKDLKDPDDSRVLKEAYAKDLRTVIDREEEYLSARREKALKEFLVTELSRLRAKEEDAKKEGLEQHEIEDLREKISRIQDWNEKEEELYPVRQEWWELEARLEGLERRSEYIQSQRLLAAKSVLDKELEKKERKAAEQRDVVQIIEPFLAETDAGKQEKLWKELRAKDDKDSPRARFIRESMRIQLEAERAELEAELSSLQEEMPDSPKEKELKERIQRIKEWLETNKELDEIERQHADLQARVKRSLHRTKYLVFPDARAKKTGKAVEKALLAELKESQERLDIADQQGLTDAERDQLRERIQRIQDWQQQKRNLEKASRKRQDKMDSLQELEDKGRYLPIQRAYATATQRFLDKELRELSEQAGEFAACLDIIGRFEDEKSERKRKRLVHAFREKEDEIPDPGGWRERDIRESLEHQLQQQGLPALEARLASMENGVSGSPKIKRKVKELKKEIHRVKEWLETKQALERNKDVRGPLEDEAKYRLERAVCRLFPDPAGTEHPPVGLAFSGGGIRSGVFNLGLVQGLAKYCILPWVDYLTSVSGGGFAAGCMTTLLSMDKKARKRQRQYYYFNTQWDRFPFNPELQVFDGDGVAHKEVPMGEVGPPLKKGTNTQLVY